MKLMGFRKSVRTSFARLHDAVQGDAEGGAEALGADGAEAPVEAVEAEDADDEEEELSEAEIAANNFAAISFLMLVVSFFAWVPAWFVLLSFNNRFDPVLAAGITGALLALFMLFRAFSAARRLG